MRCFIITITAVAAMPVLAAHADSSVMIDQVSAGASYAYLQQHGIGNMTVLDQTNGAVASIRQIGNDNTVSLHQTVGDSVTSTQIGNGLGYSMEQSPNAGHVTITQHR